MVEGWEEAGKTTSHYPIPLPGPLDVLAARSVKPAAGKTKQARNITESRLRLDFWKLVCGAVMVFALASVPVSPSLYTSEALPQQPPIAPHRQTPGPTATQVDLKSTASYLVTCPG